MLKGVPVLPVLLLQPAPCGVQAINGVPRLTEGLNPATWMLQVSTPGMEANIGVNFAEIYKDSGLYQ